MSAPLLTLTEVTKSYRMGEVDVQALRDVSLTIGRGELVVVLGPSGCGKSTLLNLIGGIDRPTSGSVRYLDRTLHDAGERALTRYRRTQVGFVFQMFNLIPTLTALENVEVATEVADEPLEPLEALRRVGLAERAGHFPSQLSGGEQQRVSIARALASNPQLLLADEPTGALDMGTGRSVLALLAEVHRELGKTVVLITHNSAIARMAGRIIRLRDGRVVGDEINEAPAPVEEISW